LILTLHTITTTILRSSDHATQRRPLIHSHIKPPDTRHYHVKQSSVVFSQIHQLWLICENRVHKNLEFPGTLH